MHKDVTIEDIKSALETIAQKKLGNGNVKILDFYVSQDSDGDEIFVIELLFKRAPDPGFGNDLTFAARNALIKMGENRFPLFYNRTSDNEAMAF